MTEWKQKLRTEFYELDASYKKITQLLESEQTEIQGEDLVLLTRQHQIMGDLHAVLHQRLHRAGLGMSLRLPWMVGSHLCDWPEDFEHENGNYFQKCMACGADFIGHKRRHMCRACFTGKTITNAD